MFLTIPYQTYTDDGDFEVTAEMLIHDTLDDETSLAVEESLQTREEEEQELNGLQAVSNAVDPLPIIIFVRTSHGSHSHLI